MKSTGYHIAATRAAARLDRRNAVATVPGGSLDLFGQPIPEPKAPPAGVAPALALTEDEAAFLLDHAADAAGEPLPEVFFRPGLFEEEGQLDFFGG